MVDTDSVWLYDEKGNQPINPYLIPPSLDFTLNDPYRSLAWLVRHAGGSSSFFVVSV